MATGVFFALACATAEQATCIEAHHRVCIHQNGASQSRLIANILLVGLGECAGDLTKCVINFPKKKTLTCSQQKANRSALTYHELLPHFISPLDLDNSARICSACRIALTSSQYKQSAECLLMEVNIFLILFVLKWERNPHIKKNIIANFSKWVRSAQKLVFS